MPTNDPIYENEMDLPVLEYSTVTSAYCNNVDLAFDYDPTTYATFFTPIGPVTPESPPATVKVPVPATLQSIAPATALIAAYQFNEGSGNTSQDAANGQSATLQVTGGTATMSWVTGEAGNALLLDGGSYAPIEANDAYMLSGEVNRSFLFRFKTTVSNNVLFQLGLISSSENGMYFAITSGHVTVAAYGVQFHGSINVADGNWHTVIIQIGPGSGSNSYIYVDGVMDYNFGFNVFINLLGTYWIYGTQYGAVAQFGGTADLFYAFNRLLTTTEISNLSSNPYLVYSAPIPPSGLNRFIHINFNTDLWITRLRYLGNGAYAGLAFDSGWDGNNEGTDGIIPLTSYLPLEIAEGVYDLVIDPPLLANGVWYLPDYLDESDGYPVVELNQLQVYIYSEDQINMANPTKNFVTLGLRSLQILPWTTSSSYPFNSANSNYPLSIQSLDISKASKVAEELGGEDVWLNNVYEYERRITGKFTVQRVNMQLLQYLLSGQLIVDNAGTANEAQYISPAYTDDNPYWTLVGFSNEGDGARTVVLPKCKVTGNISEMWDRTKLTAFDITFEAVWDTTYICTTGRIGGIQEAWYNNNATNTPVYS